MPGALPIEAPSDGPNAGGHWLGPAVRGIGGASLLSDLGHEVPTSFLPSLLTSTLGAPAAPSGASRARRRRPRGSREDGGGALADDPERRRVIAGGGCTTTAVLSGLIGVAGAAWLVGVLRAGA
jgi:hypothetical protein